MRLSTSKATELVFWLNEFDKDIIFLAKVAKRNQFSQQEVRFSQ